MEDHPPYDPRQIANEVIDLAREFQLEVTHLSLQKIIYFLHESFLKEGNGPLCLGYFEAWKHGPVHPQLWTTFKAAGRTSIRHHAYGVDIGTGLPRALPKVTNTRVRMHIVAEGVRLLKIPAARLVGISHAKGSPWDRLTTRSGGQREYGARISNELVLECRIGAMVPIRDAIADEEDLYEQPPS